MCKCYIFVPRVKSTVSFAIPVSRAFLKHSAEVVYLLEGKHVSVILQGNEINGFVF